MATQHGPGAHWSASNPVPTIQKFMEGLDKDKKERDRQIEEAEKLKQQKKRESRGGDAVPHRPSEENAKGSRGRTVRDPTTGRDVEIEDVDKGFTESVQDPKVKLEIPFVEWLRGKEREERLMVFVAFGSECESWETYGKNR